MAKLAVDGVKFVPEKKEQLKRLLEIRFSEQQLFAAEVYHYRGEFCPVKKGLVTYADWFPTDKQIEAAGVPIIDVIKRAKSEGREESKRLYYQQGVNDERARYEQNEDYLRLCMDAAPSVELETRTAMLDAREQALEIATQKANEREETLREYERQLVLRERVLQSKADKATGKASTSANDA